MNRLFEMVHQVYEHGGRIELNADAKSVELSGAAAIDAVLTYRNGRTLEGCSITLGYMEFVLVRHDDGRLVLHGAVSPDLCHKFGRCSNEEMILRDLGHALHMAMEDWLNSVHVVDEPDQELA